MSAPQTPKRSPTGVVFRKLANYSEALIEKLLTAQRER